MDVETLRNLKDGSYAAFKTIYQEWKGKVYFYFLSKTKEEEFAKELTQLAFIKVWEYRSSVDIQLSVEQQIFQKARLIFIDHLRKQAKEKTVYAADADLDIRHTPHNSFEERQSISLAIETLPKGRKEIFELKYIQGYSYKEIASMLSISTKTVDNQLLKALKHLREKLRLNEALLILLMVELMR